MNQIFAGYGQTHVDIDNDNVDDDDKSAVCFSFFITDCLQDVEEVLKRIQAHKGVIGTIVINQDGELKF